MLVVFKILENDLGFQRKFNCSNIFHFG